MKPNEIVICSTCSLSDESPQKGEVDRTAQNIAQALENDGLASEFAVTQVACMSACEEPTALAIQGKDRATYLFSGFDPAENISDIIATCRAYLDAPDGWIEDARPCGKLREHLRSRVPALNRD